MMVVNCCNHYVSNSRDRLLIYLRIPAIFHMETMLLYLCGVVEVPKLSFPANKSKWIGHTKAQLKT